MLIGAAGTITMNLLFGIASFWGLLGLFVAIRGVDGYMQAFGAPGMVKMNAAWFRQNERGRFGGIFGFMINLGRFGIFTLGPAPSRVLFLLGSGESRRCIGTGFFWVPALVATVVALLMAIIVKDAPEQAGYPSVNPEEEVGGEVRATIGEVFVRIASNPVVRIIALAYACTGAVRQGIDQWFPRFMQEAHHVDYSSAQFQFLGFLIPFVASVGSLLSGYVSDKLFNGRRARVAAGLYFLETAIILLAA